MDRKEPQVLIDKIYRHEPFRILERALVEGDFPIGLSEAESPFLALVLAALWKRRPRHLFVVLPTDREAEDFTGDLAFYGANARLLPWWNVAAYRPAAVRSRAFGERASILADLACGNGGIIVASHRAFVTPVPPKDYLAGHLIPLKQGQSFQPDEIAEKLAASGYLRVPRVALPGEFAQRGEVIDVFMPGDAQALRIQFGYDAIEKITRFDPGSQSGYARVEDCILRPLKEVIWTQERAEALGRRGEELPGCRGRMDAVVESLAQTGEWRGEECWYGLAFDAIHGISEYFDESAVLFALNRERLDAQEESARKEYAGMYRAALRDNPVPPPERCLNTYAGAVAATNRIVSSFALKDQTQSSRLSMGGEPPRSFFGNIKYFREDLANFEKIKTQTYLAASSDIQADRIASLLQESAAAIIVGELSAGFAIPALQLRVVQENEIFGRRKRVPKSLAMTKSAIIDSFVELSPGDYVVHVNYGIGRFASIERMRVLGNERDYIKVEYADDETVFVPIEQANLIQRYIGNEGESPRLDKLGSKSWENRKNRVKKSVEELAERLIRIYARRKAAKGYAFPKDGEWQTEFEAAFPYQETIDQLRCIEEIKADMESDKPMDRLVCGDVGYGKTEVALRACFKAMMSGKQVAFLAPTTILAEQHFENFRDRLEGYPMQIAMMSRLVEKKQQRKTLQGLLEGKIDMVIGTHRLLQKDVVFKDMGLLVIDEEQRFGVKAKERLKEIKAGIDCLTLTATPIPRTLHMSMLKIRDMSILQTPPATRQPIQTFVEEFNPETVARAIRSEMERGGQVFYLHNRVESLQEVEQFIRSVVPEALTESAHGQMEVGELEDIMHRFIHGAFHVLVSTTIIENGIDIPNVNTIIIDRADIYGVSQLYQLKGRVGRSDREAYAYLLYPDKRALTEIAMKRLQIISDFTELGSGFKVAMKDLEVRGAGNLLGREQSGDIYAVGFDMYLKLLDEAVNALSGTPQEEEEPYLELEYSGYIPDTYISMPMIKMEIYKKIASIYRQGDLDGLQEELESRFGPLPDEVQSLLSLAEIRILCRKLSVSLLKERGGTVTVEFSKVSKISVDRLLRLMRESNGRVKLDPRKPNAIILQTKAIGLREKSEFIRERLASLA
jgi:transcription-repair coupling factor (superfamily II helicase)